MRHLTERERDALEHFLDLMADHLRDARANITRGQLARSITDAPAEIDFARGHIEDVAALAELTNGYLIRLARSTARARTDTWGNGVTPPRLPAGLCPAAEVA